MEFLRKLSLGGIQKKQKDEQKQMIVSVKKSISEI